MSIVEMDPTALAIWIAWVVVCAAFFVAAAAYVVKKLR